MPKTPKNQLTEFDTDANKGEIFIRSFEEADIPAKQSTYLMTSLLPKYEYVEYAVGSKDPKLAYNEISFYLNRYLNEKEYKYTITKELVTIVNQTKQTKSIIFLVTYENYAVILQNTLVEKVYFIQP